MLLTLFFGAVMQQVDSVPFTDVPLY